MRLSVWLKKERFVGLLKGHRNQKCSPDFQICSLAGMVGWQNDDGSWSGGTGLNSDRYLASCFDAFPCFDNKVILCQIGQGC